jgi:hypothetical protein
MKKLMGFLFSLLIFIGSTLAQSEDAVPEYKNHLSIEPFTFFAGGIQVGYERNIGQYGALKLLVGYYHREDPYLIYSNGTLLRGANAQFTAKRFFRTKETAPSRFYMGALGLFKFGELNTLETYDFPQTGVALEKTRQAAAVGVGTVFGLTIYTKPGFYMDFSLGGMMNFSLGPEDDADYLHAPVVNPYLTGVAPRMNIGIGYSF